MKKTLALVGLMLILVLVFAAPALAVKPTMNLAAAKVVPWNLSASVMPVPPYGSVDIPGSDTASKLIVNQPNGNTEVTITGAMAGLAPLTTYTVYLSNGYLPYQELGWNVTGSYGVTLSVTSGTGAGSTYLEYLDLAWDATNGVTGNWLATNAAGTASKWVVDSGNVTENQLVLFAHYATVPAWQVELDATIAADGSLVNGVWKDLPGGYGNRIGTWASTAGHATKVSTGNSSWTGFFSTQQAFTFATDEVGAASWHVNLTDADFPGVGIFDLSVWINGGGKTMLISDTFTVVKD